jgi:microcystin-dependent protein
MNEEDYIASVGLTAALYAPRNTALCQGQIVSINQNMALYALIGNLYEDNDSVTTFALPDLRGSVPFGTGAAVAGPPWNQGDKVPVLTEHAWPQGWPERAGPGQTTTVPTPSGPTGTALNWAITLQGIFPPRNDW